MILTVDPGINAAGFAFWDEAEFKTRCLPAHVFTLKAELGGEWHDRLQDLLKKLDTWMDKRLTRPPTAVFCEMPVLFAGSVGHAVARRGGLTELAAAAGAFMTVGKYGYPVPVNEWIGQLPKEVMHRRVRSTLEMAASASEVQSLMGSPTHHWDAVGVGLYVQGYFK